MKKCPFCAEGIQDDAIKCKHCGEWIKEYNNSKTNPPLAAFPVTSHRIEQPSKKNASTPPALKEIPIARLISFIALLPAAIILFDFILGVTSFKLSQELAESEWRIIAYLLYLSLGIWLADYIYAQKSNSHHRDFFLPTIHI